MYCPSGASLFCLPHPGIEGVKTSLEKPFGKSMDLTPESLEITPETLSLTPGEFEKYGYDPRHLKYGGNPPKVSRHRRDLKKGWILNVVAKRLEHGCEVCTRV